VVTTRDAVLVASKNAAAVVEGLLEELGQDPLERGTLALLGC